MMQNSGLENFAKSLNGYLLKNLTLEEWLQKSNIAESNGSVVLTLDSEFGNGKTSFLKYFQEEYQKIDKFHAIIYIDTWQADYLNNPILSIVKQIVKHPVFFESQKKKKLQKATINVVKTIAKINKLSEAVVDGMVNNFFSQKDEIAELKKTLEELTKDKKILFLIDELDRCKPSYAIEFLETIKHLFYQPNTAFVIATNLLQLSSSAKALFGAELDFKNYYRKFSPVVWQLPRTSENLQDQYNKIFQAFYNAYKLNNNIKGLLDKVYSKVYYHFPPTQYDEKKADFVFEEHFLLKIKPSLREIKSVFHIFFDVIKNLKIEKSTPSEKLGYFQKEPYVILEQMYIDESLLLHMLVSILLKICQSLEKEKIDKQQKDVDYLNIFGQSTNSDYINGIVNYATQCIKQYSLAVDSPYTRIIVFTKDGFIHGMPDPNYSNPPIYYHLYPFNHTDNKIPVSNFNSLSEKIESLLLKK